MADTPPPQPDQVTPGTTGSWDVVEGEDNGLGHFLRPGQRPAPRGRPSGPGLLLPGDQLGTRCFAKGDFPQSWFVSRLGTVEGKDIPDLEVDTLGHIGLRDG